MVCALGFTREHISYKWLVALDEEGLFVWSDRTKAHVKKEKFKGAATLDDKQLHMVPYLLDFFYDIALSSVFNVSQSPGFETPLGCW